MLILAPLGAVDAGDPVVLGGWDYSVNYTVCTPTGQVSSGFYFKSRQEAQNAFFALQQGKRSGDGWALEGWAGDVVQLDITYEPDLFDNPDQAQLAFWQRPIDQGGTDCSKRTVIKPLGSWGMGLVGVLLVASIAGGAWYYSAKKGNA